MHTTPTDIHTYIHTHPPVLFILRILSGIPSPVRPLIITHTYTHTEKSRAQTHTTPTRDGKGSFIHSFIHPMEVGQSCRDTETHARKANDSDEKQCGRSCNDSQTHTHTHTHRA